MLGRTGATKAGKQLAAALRAGDESAAKSLADRSGIPAALLRQWELGPWGTVDRDTAALALSCVAALAEGTAVPAAWLSDPDVIGLVADMVELVAPEGSEHPWLRGITALDGADCPGVPELLRARAAEGGGRSDEARLLIDACLDQRPGLVPAMRDATEYELCAGNWARAFELASSLGDDDAIARPLLRPLARLREPALGTERTGRNQPCPCGSGRKYKACCRVNDLKSGTHPLPDRAPALYAMLATYTQRALGRQVADRFSGCALGAPQAAMLALDLAIFDGGFAARFLTSRGHLLRVDERELLEDWLGRPVDMYEVTRVNRGSELMLRSMVGGPAQVRQRDRMFSMSATRLDIVIGRLLPDGERLPDGSCYLRSLSLMGKLDRSRRNSARDLFTGGPVVPGTDPDFPVRLVSQFAPDGPPAVTTADGEEYRFCEATIDVAGAGEVWDSLTRECLPVPEPPVRDLAGYDAFIAEVPSRFWSRNSETEIEYVGLLNGDRLTNLGTIVRTRRGFQVTANSARRTADLIAIVLDAAAAAGRSGKVTRQSAKTAVELIGESGEDDGPKGREAMCRWLGLDAALVAVPPRGVIMEEHFLPLDHVPGIEMTAAEIERELALRSVLEASGYDSHTAGEALKLGGAARDEVLAMIDDSEWRLARADAETAPLMPRPADIRRRLGIR